MVLEKRAREIFPLPETDVTRHKRVARYEKADRHDPEGFLQESQTRPSSSSNEDHILGRNEMFTGSSERQRSM